MKSSRRQNITGAKKRNRLESFKNCEHPSSVQKQRLIRQLDLNLEELKSGFEATKTKCKRLNKNPKVKKASTSPKVVPGISTGEASRLPMNSADQPQTSSINPTQSIDEDKTLNPESLPQVTSCTELIISQESPPQQMAFKHAQDPEVTPHRILNKCEELNADDRIMKNRQLILFDLGLMNEFRDSSGKRNLVMIQLKE